MKIVFFGSSHFALPALKTLIKSGHELVCVVTQPDKKKGRHLRFAATDVKSVAMAAKLKIFQPEDIKAKESLNFLKKLGADLFVIIAYGQIFSQEALDIPAIMPINIHASLLPRFRGAAPINWAIINGEKKSGLSVMYVTRQMDSGPVMLQKEIKIEDQDTSVTLEEKLSQAAPGILMDALKLIEGRNYRLVEQDEDKVILAPKLTKQDGLIDWNTSAVDIHNQIRGTLPWPGAFTSYRRQLLKIFQADPLPVFPAHKALAGEVVRADKHGIVVAASRGFLEIKELQLEAARRMSAENFVMGHKLTAGEILGKKS